MDEVCIQIRAESGETKQQQLINELVRVINTELNEGDMLPSVNTVSRQLKISRDTVFKAYRELKQRGLVEAMPNKGYFVNREVRKVLLLLDYYSPHKETVYRQVLRNLGSAYTVDLLFHHYNQRLFDSIIRDSIGRYNFYIVMNINTREFTLSDVLTKVDPAKLLLLDIPVYDWNNADASKYNYVCQDFEHEVFRLLEELHPRISKYNKFHLVNPVHLKHPKGTIRAFEKYCAENSVLGSVLSSTSLIEVKKGEAYFVLRQPDLQTVLEACRDQQLIVGKDAGILAYNDSSLYEFVSCGITVISADFRQMGNKASEFITGQNSIREFIPSKIIIRKSL